MEEQVSKQGPDVAVLGCPGLAPGKGGSCVVVTPTKTYISGGADDATSNKNSIAVTRDSGTIIVGRTAFITTPENIRIGLQNVLNNLLTGGIPSTALTPIPVMNFSSDVEMEKLMMDTMKDGMLSMESILRG